MDKNYTIKYFSQITTIIEKYSNVADVPSENVNVHIEKSILSVENALEVIEKNGMEFKFTTNLKFIICQLKLIRTKHKKYSMDDFLMAMTIFMYSPTCYNVIRDHGFIILPHEKTIKKLKACQDIGVNKVSSNENYFTNIIEKLEEHEKIIIVQIDEVYCKTKCQYKAKTLTGYAENSNNLAKTVLSFLISSIYGSLNGSQVNSSLQFVW